MHQRSTVVSSSKCIYTWLLRLLLCFSPPFALSCRHQQQLMLLVFGRLALTHMCCVSLLCLFVSLPLIAAQTVSPEELARREQHQRAHFKAYFLQCVSLCYVTVSSLYSTPSVLISCAELFVPCMHMWTCSLAFIECMCVFTAGCKHRVCVFLQVSPTKVTSS